MPQAAGDGDDDRLSCYTTPVQIAKIQLSESSNDTCSARACDSNRRRTEGDLCEHRETRPHRCEYESVHGDQRHGVTVSRSVTVRVDLTAPTITGGPTSPANANGWYNTRVQVVFNCTDQLSGVASCTGQTTLFVDGAARW